MIKNYLTVALRNLQRRKAYSFINIGGLALGMGCAILIFLSVRHDLSFDRFHEDSDRIYRVLSIDRALGVTANHVGVTIPALGPAMEEELPEVELAVRMSPTGRNLWAYEDRSLYSEGGFNAEAAFFELFDFPLVVGDPATALVEPLTVVPTRSLARRLFGDEYEAVGKVIRVNGTTDYRITGVVEDPPANSHLTFDAIGSLVPTEAQAGFQQMLQSWNSIALITYVRLAASAQAESLDVRMEEILRRNESPAAWSATLQPLHDIHLRSSDIVFDINDGKSDLGYVYGLGAFALFLLAIAIFNFMNLATARAAERAREVGVRKVVGAGKRQLMLQHLGESFIMTALAFLLALAGVATTLSVAGDLFGTSLSPALLLDAGLAAGMLGLVAVVALLAGAYPAFVLSGFQPMSVLKGAFRHSRHGELLRRGLVVVQFTAAIVMIVGALVVSRQLDFIMGKNVGYDREQVVVVDLNNQTLQQRAPALMEELERAPGIRSVSRAGTVPGRGLGRTGVVPEGAGDEDSWIVSMMSIDENYLQTLGMNLVEGRNFSDEYGTDQQQALLINEAAARAFGWSSDPVGRIVTGGGGVERTVVGVVGDFHFVSFRQAIEPIVFYYNVGSRPTLTLRIEGRDAGIALAQIEQAWSGINPEFPFEYAFLDEEFAQMYAQEGTFARLARVFTLLSIVIACLGLFGLAAFATEQRTREIGVRKVMGASVPGIMMLFVRQFGLLVALAFLIAAPLAWLATRGWLADFAYRIDLGPGLFVLAGMLVIATAVLTVSYQSFRAAMADPVRSLRYE
jgi:putative ABC transport system permease protein